MVTGFPALLIGFEWHRQGISFAHVLVSVTIGSAIVLAYYIPVCSLSSRTGLSFKHLSRQVFGVRGTRILIPCLLFIFFGWYTVCSLLMADVVCGLFGLKSQFVTMSVIFAFGMAFNNFFGFKGVANFAKCFAGPVLIAWILYSLVKVAPVVPSSALVEAGKTGFETAFVSISSFIIGFAVWGNEADYWRHSKPGTIPVAVALALSLFVGEIIFPVTGWLVAASSGITDSAAATSYMNQFSFAGLAWLAVLVLGANYFAANDSNLYAITHALEGAFKQSHKKMVFLVACLCAIAAFVLARMGASSALERICALNCVILPTATVLIVAEWLVVRRGRWQHSHPGSEIRWPALVAFGVGSTAGLLTSGILPGFDVRIGMPPLQAWALALCVYIPWRLLETRVRITRRLDIDEVEQALSEAHK